MGRPPLRVGSHGSISFRVLGPKRVRAMAWVRDSDGRARQVTALGTSKSDARAGLLAKLEARAGIGGDLTGDSLLSDVAAGWMVEVARLVADGQRAPNTERVCRFALDLHMLPAVGALRVRVRVATVPLLNAFVVTMREHHRAGITTSSRTVLNGILGHTVRAGARWAPTRFATSPSRSRSTTSTQPGRSWQSMGT